MTAGGQSHLTPRLHRGTIVERCESFTPLTHNVLSVLMARRAHSIDPIQVNRSAVQLKSFVKATEHGRRGSSAPYRLGISGFEFNRPLVGSLELNPDVWPGDSMLSQIYVLQGRPQDALPEIKLVRYDHQRAYLYAIAYYALGRKRSRTTHYVS